MILRKDSWSHEEDVVLTETVLAYGREGKTQKDAFNYVHLQLPHRSFSAINQRWNTYLKSKALKTYQREVEREIQEEKQIEQPVESVVKSVINDVITLDEIERIMNMPNIDPQTIVMMNMKLRELVKPMSPLLKSE